MTNLVNDAWIPVTTTSGERLIKPSDITAPDVIALAAPRADFNAALLQFLIGLLQTACAPPNEEKWRKWLETPPSADELQTCFSGVQSAFRLEGDTPCFMQDFSPLEGDTKPVAALLIDAPGAQTLKQNADHFIKRGGAEKLCPSCAATALFTLQTNAPSGGAGHRTSLRGGGPLTTLVALDSQETSLRDSLWRRCWLNVLSAPKLAGLSGNGDKNALNDVFPWMAATRTSKAKGDVTTPEDAHSLQMFWAMPRRIQLHWQQGDVICDLCGAQADHSCAEYTTQNYGVNYEGAWQHPLSPHSSNKDGLLLPQHAQPGGMHYGHWLGMVSKYDNRMPAQVVTTFVESQGQGRIPGARFRLHAFGYDMDNMKARCWYESIFPLFPLDESIRDRFVVVVEQLLNASKESAGMARGCIKEAWFKRPGDAKGDTQYLIEAFFSQTEVDFYRQLDTLIEVLNEGADDLLIRQAWHRVLLRTANVLFDQWTSRGAFESANPRRIADAHTKLNKLLHSKKLKQSILNLPSHKEKAA